jgi:cysteine desulfurase
MWANNETGVINDIDAIGAVCRERGILFHSDGAQAVGRIPTNLQRSPIDLLSLSGHKIYGPKGVGALITTRAARRVLRPLQEGGGQERGLRPGTLPVHQLVGLGEAANLAARDLEPVEVARVAGLRDRFLTSLRAALAVEVNGSVEHRLPGNLNLWFKGCDTEALAIRCREVAFSTGSACTSASFTPSYVITALSDEQRAAESARFAFGRFTTDDDAKHAAEAITRSVLELHALSPRGRDAKTLAP